MVEIGYKLSSEEHGPNELVRFAGRAEAAGFAFAMISDHYHPWTSKHGQSPFVWSVIGAIAHGTHRLRLGTGVTCPTRRLHPAIVAQAAATAEAMMPGRFFLGVGSGENLNEHVVGGDAWPPPPTRVEMLAEAIEVIRALWTGDEVTHEGAFFSVDEARLYTLPAEPPPIYLAGSGKRTGELAARVADGLIGTSPNREMIEAFGRKPCIGEIGVCFDADEKKALRTAHEWWPTAGLKGGSKLQWETKTPELFDEMVKNVRPEDVRESVLCSADPKAHLAKIREFSDAGYDHVCVHQIGPDQDRFFDFYEKEVIQRLS
jgi:coenzyme F420-dependent glucose-6-phosphate dehydrogenase